MSEEKKFNQEPQAAAEEALKSAKKNLDDALRKNQGAIDNVKVELNLESEIDPAFLPPAQQPSTGSGEIEIDPAFKNFTPPTITPSEASKATSADASSLAHSGAPGGHGAPTDNPVKDFAKDAPNSRDLNKPVNAPASTAKANEQAKPKENPAKAADPNAKPAADPNAKNAARPGQNKPFGQGNPNSNPSANARSMPRPGADPNSKPSSSPSGSSNAAKALDAAKAAKNLTSKDPNAGAAGNGAKAAGALAAAKGALEGYNQGGLKGAAAKGAIDASNASRNANAKAANGAASSPGKNGEVKGQGKMGAAASLAGSGIKAAIITALTSATGVPPEVWAKVFSKQTLMILVALVLVPIMVIGGLLLNPGGATIAAPDEYSDEQAEAYFPPGWSDLLRDAAAESQNNNVSIPWTVLGGIAKTATDFGRTSPYDTIDHDKPRKQENITDSPDPEAATVTVSGTTVPTTEPTAEANAYAPGVYADGAMGSCGVRMSDPVIGGGEGQAKGPFLLTSSAWRQAESEGVNVDDPCDVTYWVANKLSETAEQMLDADPNLVSPWDSDDLDPSNPDAKRDASAKFWAQTISNSGIIQDPTGGLDGGECTVRETPGVTMPVPYLVNQIWNCEISKVASDLEVLSGMDPNASDKDFLKLDSYSARMALLDEAQKVSYNFSNWDNSTCNPSASGPTGIFPLDAATASAYGATDRCNAQQNIRAAARAVLAIESQDAASRATNLGAYQPLLGGWLNLSSVFGEDKKELLEKGTITGWVASDACLTAATEAISVSQNKASEFANRNNTSDWSDDQGWTDKFNATFEGDALNQLKTSCAAPTDYVFYQTLGDALDTVIAEVQARQAGNSAVITLPGVSNDDILADTEEGHTISRLAGLSAYIDAHMEVLRSQMPTAEYGKTSLIPRLARTESTIAVGDTSSALLNTEITTAATKASEYAIFYGGVNEPFDTVGVRTGSLILPTMTPGGSLNSSLIPAELAPLFAANQRCELITPAVLAAVAQQESGFNPAATNKTSSAKGLGQLIDGTWNSYKTDGDGDGKTDVFNAADNIATMSVYLCRLSEITAGWDMSQHDHLTWTLGAYNQGEGGIRGKGQAAGLKYAEEVKTKLAALSSPITAGTISADGCPTAAPANTLRGGSDKIGVAQICANSVAQARSPEAARAIIFALNHMGLPYSQPKRNQEGWYDCSSYTTRSYQAAGVNIAPPGQNAPNTRSMRGARWAVPIAFGTQLPGDLIQPTSGHVAMQLSDGFVVHTNRPGDVSHIRAAYTSAYWVAYVDPSRV